MTAQIANIPLECPTMPIRIGNIKGCEFVPPVILSRGKLYLIVVTFKKWWTPQRGFYDVPDKGYYTWIERFVLIARSDRSITNGQCFVFECYEGSPPENVVPYRMLMGGKKVRA